MANRAKSIVYSGNRGSRSGAAPALPSDLFLPHPRASDLAGRLGWLDEPPLDDHARWFREGDNVTALHARAAGRRTRLVGLTWVDGYQGVLALPGSGIAEPADLAGRRLALPLRTDAGPGPGADGDGVDAHRAAARRGFHAATALVCLFCDEFSYVDVPAGTAREAAEADPYAAETSALLRGEVDAIYVAGRAGRALADAIGAVEVVDLGAHLDPMVRVNATTPAALTVDERVLADDPRRVVELLAALLRAGAWAETHPDAVRRAYGGRGLEQQLHVDLSARKLAALAAQKEFLLTHGVLAGDVDLTAWAAPELLAAARELIAEQSVRR